VSRKKFSTGHAFSDYVEKNTFSFSKKDSYSTSFTTSSLLVIFPLFLLGSIFLIITLRLFFVQIVQGSYYARLSDENRTRTVNIPSPRGIIFDRFKRPLVRNVPAFEIIEKTLPAGKQNKVKILPRDEALELINKGKNVIETTSREYLYKDVFAHVLGYTGQISEEELTQEFFKSYALTDFTGKMGIEKQYENKLYGKNGRKLYEVDANGKEIRFLGQHEEVSGDNLYTTLDIDVQQASERAFKDVEKGAVVVSDPRNGGILAIYSKPTFDPNLFTHSERYVADGDYKTVLDIVNDSEKQPLLDRAIGGVYPPGSTFKLVTAVAALSSGAIKPETEFEDTGILRVGEFSFGNWYFLQYGGKDGNVDVVKAIKRSNDIFFYHASEETGVNTISNWARRMGVGKKLGIDLPEEEQGTVPTERWKERVIGEKWYLGDTYNYGIGQGYLLTTPLQVNFWTTVFANNGTLYKPHLIKNEKKVLEENIIKKEYINLIKKGMEESCEQGGVAWPLFNFTVQNDRIKLDNLDFTQGSASQSARTASDSAKLKKGNYVRVKIGCKTGTAETGGKETEPHAWITVFAPYHDPEIAVTVLVENGGEGSSVAGPIARDILKEYFEKK
jgi:penicillin-binding protein 2